MKKQYQLYLGIVMAACSLNASSTSLKQVGSVDDFDGALTNYRIERGTETIPMGVYAPLYPGDRIYVINKNHSINIKLCNEVHQITHQDSPYLVPSKKCDVIGLTDNIWLGLKDFAKYVTTIVQQAPPIEIYTKSGRGAVVMPMLDRTFFVTPTLKAGERALSFQWFGGKSPYQVQITTAKKELLWQTEAETDSVKTAQIHFKAGHTYWIIITTANETKSQTKREFKVVAKLPDYPKPLQDNTLPENMRRTLQAAWMAEQDRIQWSFEAYQQVFDLADNYGPARELRKALALGKK